MLFNSKAFAVFLVVVLGVYYRLPGRWRVDWLILASAVFYAFPDPRPLLLVLAAIVTGWACALGIRDATSLRDKRVWLAVCVGINLGFLLFFKYWDFGVRSVQFWADVFGAPVDVSWLQLELLLPLGISFHTFQVLSYAIDVYRGVCPAEPSLRKVAAYILFFPTLAAGPVERATHLLPQYDQPLRLTRPQVYEGVLLLLLGVFKKTVLADRLAEWIAPQFASGPGTSAIAWTSVLLFTTDIYVDFSAYADIALGAGRLLGYDIRPNFDLPFVVPSIPERWRRWHISMSHWFRDYVYIPLGGNRKGEVRANLNVLIVMFLSGLWHGASYNFVVWGLLNGTSMVGHRVLRPVLKPLAAASEVSRATKWAYFYVCCAVTMLMISSINIFFRSDTWDVAKQYVALMFGVPPWRPIVWMTRHALPDGYVDGLVILAGVAFVHELERHFGLRDWLLRRRWAWAATCLGMLVAIVIFGIKGTRFIYYKF